MKGMWANQYLHLKTVRLIGSCSLGLRKLLLEAYQSCKWTCSYKTLLKATQLYALAPKKLPLRYLRQQNPHLLPLSLPLPFLLWFSDFCDFWRFHLCPLFSQKPSRLLDAFLISNGFHRLFRWQNFLSKQHNIPLETGKRCQINHEYVSLKLI